MISKTRRGFTVVELLVVIAIMSILMAITFPIVASVQRKNKETLCMTNLSQIYTAMKAFQQDQHCYPDFIAGPVQWVSKKDNNGNDVLDSNNNPIVATSGGNPVVVPMEKSTGTLKYAATVDGSGHPSFFAAASNPDQIVALYPEYIKSVSSLNCPNLNFRRWDTSSYQKDPMFTVLSDLNVAADSDTSLTSLSVLRVGQPLPSPADQAELLPFYLYTYSTYDIQTLTQAEDDSKAGEVHFSNAWGNDPSDSNYTRQLHWRNPTDDCIITWCGSHRDSKSHGDDLVLFLDGRTQRVHSDLTSDWQNTWKKVTPRS